MTSRTERDARYREKRRETRRASDAAYRAANREKRAEYRKATRDHRAAYDREWARKNAEHKASQANRKQVWWARWTALLREAQGCAVCGTHDGYLLHHHVDPATKRFQVSMMSGLRLETFFDEIAKCTVLCMSCHRRVHHEMKTTGSLYEPKEQT